MQNIFLMHNVREGGGLGGQNKNGFDLAVYF